MTDLGIGKDIVYLDGDQLAMDQIPNLAAGAPVKVSEDVVSQIKESRAAVEKAAASGTPVYGVNTGFGYFSNTTIDHDGLKQLQLNIIRSHASGWGNPLSEEESRLAMVFRLNVLAKGHTGVRLELIQALEDLINSGITPIIPEYGSVGASGDLAPLAHLALPLVGEGEVMYRGTRQPAAEALAAAGLTPIELQEKEGLSLVNGTQVMLAVGSLALSRAIKLLNWAGRAVALSYEGLEARPTPLHPELHELRGQVGQIASAAAIRQELEGSRLYSGIDHPRLQDPYSLRCAPQIMGPTSDALDYCQTIIERELNAATDNPLVLSDGTIISGGNFHGQAIALPFDFAGMAVAELGNVSERRLELLLNPHMSKLPAFLSSDEGLCSGYMAAQYLAGSLVNANKGFANPASTDSIPGNVGIEDFVSMGMTSARKLRTIVENVEVIVTIELLAAAQAVDLRGITPEQLGEGSRATYEAVRAVTPMLVEDRVIAIEIEKTHKSIFNR
jgi:histidine ammonia-lyase